MGKIIIILFLINSSAITIYSQNNLRETLDKIILRDTEISFEKTPGFIVSVLVGDSIYVEYFGNSLDKDNNKLTAHSVFPVSGISKIFTSIILQKVLCKKNINLSDSIYPYFEGISRRFVKKENWSFLSLLNHTTGLAKIPTGLGAKERIIGFPYSNYQKEDLFQYLESEPILSDAGIFKYGHIDYAIIEYLIEQISGTKIEEHFFSEFIKPLNLTESHIYSSQSVTSGLSNSHLIIDKNPYSSFGGSLGMTSSISDLNKITLYLLDLYNTEEPCLKTIWDSTVKTQIRDKLNFTTTMYRVDYKKHASAFMHSGHSRGHYAYIGILPQTKSATVILANSAAGVENLSLLTLRMINGIRNKIIDNE